MVGGLCALGGNAARRRRALIGATVARSLAFSSAVREGRTEYETSCGLRMAWRIAWQVFLFSTLFAGVGYGLMVLIGLLSR